MGSAEGFSVGGVVVKVVPREIQGACSSGSQKEKPQMFKQKNNSNCRRGDKRNSKVQKNKCDLFSLKNGLVGFNSAAGGNNFFGLYGLKPDAFDITKYVNELSLDDLLHGRCNTSAITDDKKKTATKPNNNLLQPVRKACSILQARKVLHAQKCAEIEKISTCSVNANSAATQINRDNCDNCITDLPYPNKVQESADKNKTNSISDFQINKPKEILQRLALPPAKDLDLLLSESSKASTSSRYCTDPRLGRTVSHRTGLPPFSWSHSFSGHNKLGADSGKLSTNRTTCNGRWAKVRDVAVMQKGSDDLLVDFESLTFDQSLVPKVGQTPVHSSDQIERLLTSAASSSMNVPSELPSPTYAAAQTLRDMATFSLKENVQLLKKPSIMKTCKLKPVENSYRPFDATKSTVRPHNSIKVSENGFPSKKLKLSIDVTNVHNKHTDSPTKEQLLCSGQFKPPPRKLFRNSNANNYSIDFVKTSYMMKPPRAVDRLSTSSQQKLKKVAQVNWSTPES